MVLRESVALAAASVLSPVAGELDPADVETQLRGIVVERREVAR